MARLRIQTRRQFREALQAVPFAGARLASCPMPDESENGEEYGLWRALGYLVQQAVADEDWQAFASLLGLYDGVDRAGPRGEMYAASYVAFLENIRLPKEPNVLRQFWQHAPPSFIRDVKHDRGIV